MLPVEKVRQEVLHKLHVHHACSGNMYEFIKMALCSSDASKYNYNLRT